MPIAYAFREKVNFMLNKLGALFLVLGLGLSCQKDPGLELMLKTQSEATEKQRPTGTCQLFFKVERICAELIWETVPELTKPASFIVKYFIQETPSKFTEPQKQPDFKLVLVGGEPQTQVIKVEKIAAGEYRASNLVFDRKGSWEIHLQLKDKNVITDSFVKIIKI